MKEITMQGIQMEKARGRETRKGDRNNWKFLILKKFSSWKCFCIRDHYLYFFYK